MTSPHVPFQISASSDDADPDARLLVAAAARRISGEVSLDPDALVFEVSPGSAAAQGGLGIMGATTAPMLRIPYSVLASAVLRRGILTNRLRITALEATTFAPLHPRNPGEVTLLISRRFRHEARQFAAALQIRIAEARLPGDARPGR